MKKQFTPNYIKENKGCYESTEHLSFINKDNITIVDILDSEIPIKDKFWFIRNKCNLTTNNKVIFSYICAKTVSPIFRDKYPNDNRVDKCINGVKDFLDGKITKEELLKLKSSAADAAYAAAYAADAYTAYAAYTADAAYAAAYAADAADAAYAAYAAAYAADAADAADAKNNTSYQQLLLQNVKDFINDLPEDL